MKKNNNSNKNEANNNNNDDQFVSDMKSIIDNSDLFVNQLYFSKYFLLQYGIKIKNENE